MVVVCSYLNMWCLDVYCKWKFACVNKVCIKGVYYPSKWVLEVLLYVVGISMKVRMC